MHAVRVVPEVGGLHELLDALLVHLLWRGVTLKAQAEAGAAVVRVGRPEEHVQMVLAKSVLNVLNRALVDVGIVPERHEGLRRNGAVGGEHTVAVLIELFCEESFTN